MLPEGVFHSSYSSPSLSSRTTTPSVNIEEHARHTPQYVVVVVSLIMNEMMPVYIATLFFHVMCCCGVHTTSVF